VQKERALEHHRSIEHAFWSFGISAKSKFRDKPALVMDSILVAKCSTFPKRQPFFPSSISSVLRMHLASCNAELASCCHSSQFFRTISSILRSSKDIFSNFECETNSCMTKITFAKSWLINIFWI